MKFLLDFVQIFSKVRMFCLEKPDLEDSFSLMEIKWSGKASIFWRSILKNIARPGFEPRTSGLWAQYASTAPLYFLLIKSKKLKGDQTSKISKNIDAFPDHLFSIKEKLSSSTK